MLEHQEALKKIFQETKPLPVTLTPLEDALGRVLGKDIDVGKPRFRTTA